MKRRPSLLWVVRGGMEQLPAQKYTRWERQHGKLWLHYPLRFPVWLEWPWIILCTWQASFKILSMVLSLCLMVNKILWLGGFGRGSYLDTIWRYDAPNNTWETTDLKLVAPVGGHAVTVIYDCPSRLSRLCILYGLQCLYHITMLIVR